MVEETAPTNARPRARRLPRHRRLGRRWSPRARRSPPTRVAERMRDARAGRPDQHPVHVGHHRLPQGRDAQPPQHPQQRLLRHRADQLHRRGPALHPGALLPLLRDGDGQPRLHHPRRHDGDPGARLRPRASRCGRSPRSAAPAVYGVPTMFIAMQNHPTFAEHDLSSLRTGIMAGSICPVEVMKRCVNDMHMAEVVDRLRHDRDLARSPARPAPTTTSSGVRRRSAGCTRTSRSRSSTRSPARPSSAGEPGEFCTRGYSVMLGYWEDAGEDRARRSTPTAGCTPATSPRCARTATATSSAGSRTW